MHPAPHSFVHLRDCCFAVYWLSRLESWVVERKKFRFKSQLYLWLILGLLVSLLILLSFLICEMGLLRELHDAALVTCLYRKHPRNISLALQVHSQRAGWT